MVWVDKDAYGGADKGCPTMARVVLCQGMAFHKMTTTFKGIKQSGGCSSVVTLPCVTWMVLGSIPVIFEGSTSTHTKNVSIVITFYQQVLWCAIWYIFHPGHAVMIATFWTCLDTFNSCWKMFCMTWLACTILCNTHDFLCMALGMKIIADPKL